MTGEGNFATLWALHGSVPLTAQTQQSRLLTFPTGALLQGGSVKTGGGRHAPTLEVRMARQPIDLKTRWRVMRRAGFRCEYCGISAHNHDVVLAVDHRVSVARGGTNREDNLACACSRCNHGKFTESVCFLPEDLPGLGYEDTKESEIDAIRRGYNHRDPESSACELLEACQKHYPGWEGYPSHEAISMAIALSVQSLRFGRKDPLDHVVSAAVRHGVPREKLDLYIHQIMLLLEGDDTYCPNDYVAPSELRGRA